MDTSVKRPETGPMKFGEDWTGVYIRGDNAFHYAILLKQILDNEKLDLDPLDKMSLNNLYTLLISSNEFAEDNSKQLLLPFDSCTKP